MKLNLASEFRWLETGDQALAEMLQAIECAQKSVRLEMYIFNASPIAEQFRDALVKACQRGLNVQVLIDAMGSITLPESFWDVFKASGGEFRWFNPISLHRFGIRDHRKILVCDEQVAFIGGLNIAPEYQGDGVERGWRDFALKICGPISKELARAFDGMFYLADFQHKRFAQVRKSDYEKTLWSPEASLLLSAPGRQRNPVKHALLSDFHKAQKIQIMAAYFLPTWSMRRALVHAVERGCKVQIILPGKTDVPLMRFASQSLYRRLLRAGVEIYEYQPQILHGKLIVIDEEIVYAGSSNLDVRSLHLNYELLLRLEHPELARQASAMFCRDLEHSEPVQLKTWTKSRTVWAKMKSRFAYFVLARLDPYFVNRQLKRLHP